VGYFWDLAIWNLISPDPKALQCVGSKRRRNGDIAGITASRHQDATPAGYIVARVEGVPAAADPCLEPGSEVANVVRRGHSEIAQVAGAVSRRDIQAAAEGDSKMHVVAADPGSCVIGLHCAAGCTGVLVVEGNVIMNIIADRLHARVAGSCAAEELPGHLRQQVSFAIATAKQKDQGFFWQRLHRVLPGVGDNLIGLIVVSDDRIGSQAEAARRRQAAVTPVSKGVMVAGDRNGRLGDEAVGDDEVGGPRMMDIHHKDDRRRLWKAINQFVSGSELHCFPQS